MHVGNRSLALASKANTPLLKHGGLFPVILLQLDRRAARRRNAAGFLDTWRGNTEPRVLLCQYLVDELHSHGTFAHG